MSWDQNPAMATSKPPTTVSTGAKLLAWSADPNAWARVEEWDMALFRRVSGAWRYKGGGVLPDYPTLNQFGAVDGIKCPLKDMGLGLPGVAVRHAGIWRPDWGSKLASQFNYASPIAAISGLPAGVIAQIWQSPIIPDWWLPDGGSLRLEVEYGVSDPASTANITIMATLAGSAPADADANAYVMSQQNPGTTWVKGMPSIGPRPIYRIGNQLRGNSGTSNTLSNTAILREFHSNAYVAGAMRVRALVNPGHVNNAFRFYGWALLAGDLS